MITGTVTANREIEFVITLLAADQSQHQRQTVIDTGFNGFLTLPNSTLMLLGAIPAGTRRAALGDGSIVELGMFLVRILWQGIEREVLALESETKPLAGMSLLWGNRVAFDAEDNGHVTIESLPQP